MLKEHDLQDAALGACTAAIGARELRAALHAVVGAKASTLVHRGLGYATVMGEDHGNLIGGRWRSAGAGEGFVVATASGAELTRRPRAGARDLTEALGALEEASHSWWGRSAGERAEVLGALELGSELSDCAAGVAARVGIGPEQALRLLEADLAEVDPWEVSQVTAPGVALVRCAPTALLSGLVPLMKRSLERGWAVLLLADPSLPWLAESFARSWLRAGAPAGALA